MTACCYLCVYVTGRSSYDKKNHRAKTEKEIQQQNSKHSYIYVYFPEQDEFHGKYFINM